MKFGVSTSQPLRPGDDSQSRGAAAASARAPSGVKLVNQTWGPSFVYQSGELSILTSHQLYVNLAEPIWQIDIEWIQMATFDKKKGDVDLKSTSTRFGWPWFWFWTINWVFGQNASAPNIIHPRMIYTLIQEWDTLGFKCKKNTTLDHSIEKQWLGTRKHHSWAGIITEDCDKWDHQLSTKPADYKFGSPTCCYFEHGTCFLSISKSC